jgi:dihydrodipicolinate synthase/N-acetylneuraminate lyase
MGPAWLRGVFPPVATPFAADGSLAAPVPGYFEHLAESGIDGVVVLGSNGEAPLLDERERLTWIRAARRSLPKPLRLVAGTGVNGTGATIRLTEAAAEAGAEAALVITPSYYRRNITVEALTAHYRAVAEASSIPIIIYNVPVFSGFDLPAEWLPAIASHPNVVGIKDSSGDLDRIRRIRAAMGPEFIVLSGAGERLMQAIEAGADGGIVALANVAPLACARVRAASFGGDRAVATQVQASVANVGVALTTRFGIPGLKAALRLQGYDHGPPRSPLRPLAKADLEALRALLEAAQLLTESRPR